MMKLTEPQRIKLDKMKFRGVRLVHFFNDNRFVFGVRGFIEPKTALPLIISGHLECVEQRDYSNVWKAK